MRKSRKIDKYTSFGGSSSAGIGLIWISGHGALDREDIAELLLHELTHHQLFIDERCHMHYNYAALCKPENFSSSAILNKKRPLDKVVHSIIVATEIILARNRFLPQQETKVHGTSKNLMDKTLTAIKETMRMANINELLSERTWKILETAEASLRKIKDKLLS
ncbi:aKG-HExxH-type peptide beta-hydroxylase [Cardinium endosymbiont of Nabis limbatus]|uniref:aKG-HExxH-type peptide beta-hydroxylase n=1 Tax=Cardinium endosymbiont of Nabis limbatus TaxID=3066217 RepID=UPI003AF3A14E